MQKLKQSFLTIAIGLALAAGLSYAWTGPTANPPLNNAPSPVNVSSSSQIKTGALQVNGFRNIGNSMFDGLATFNSSIKIPAGAGAGKVLTSDTSGNASWGNAGGGIGGSGTANYVSKWTNSTTLGNSQIFDNGTNVGIGTANPQAKLDIAGSVKIVDGTQGAGKVLTSDASGKTSWGKGYVSGGLYGYCQEVISQESWSKTANVFPPATTAVNSDWRETNCVCPGGFTLVALSDAVHSCYKL